MFETLRLDANEDRAPPVARRRYRDARAQPRVPPSIPRPLSWEDDPPKVAVLMCTLHGQHFLAAQLNSIAEQTYGSWRLWVSDDGSSDRTGAILERYRALWGRKRMTITPGPRAGFVTNFLSLTCESGIRASYYAYADQDDAWEPEKLARAIAWLKTVPESVPALYCSRTRLIDGRGRNLGLSPLFGRTPSFANALVQNIGGGNTMVFNHAARALLSEAGSDVPVVTHDWWAYMVVTGCGGRVHYDPHPTVRYRQHSANLIGSSCGNYSRFGRLVKLFKGRFRDWNDVNTRALQRIRPLLTEENRRILDEFCTARNRSLVPRIAGFRRSRVYRQTLFGNLSLAAAAVLKKL